MVLIVFEFSSDTIEVNVALIIETIHIIFVDRVVMLYLKKNKNIFIVSERKKKALTIKNKIQ
jgi:hypothetical protein